ncbi:MAG TPA: hypothetical protein VHE30_18105 [Polyangiaceae bacterium]|nr:hypothetical protein [Polyangiaceae bacterium]
MSTVAPPPDEPSLAGDSVLSSRQSLEEIVGADVVNRAIELLSDADREAYLGAKAGSWLPVRIADEFQRAVAREARIAVDAFPEFVRAFCHRSVERMVGTVWRLVLHVLTDHQLVDRANELHRRTYNVGRLTARVDGPGVATISLSEWPSISDEQMIGTAAGIEAVLGAAGRKNVSIRWKRTADGADYAATWTPT